MNNPIVEIKAQEDLRILFIIVNILLYLADLKLEEAPQKGQKAPSFSKYIYIFSTITSTAVTLYYIYISYEKYKNDTKDEDLETDKIKIFAYLLSLVSLLIFLYTQLTQKVTETDETLL